MSRFLKIVSSFFIAILIVACSPSAAQTPATATVAPEIAKISITNAPEATQEPVKPATPVQGETPKCINTKGIGAVTAGTVTYMSTNDYRAQYMINPKGVETVGMEPGSVFTLVAMPDQGETLTIHVEYTAKEFWGTAGIENLFQFLFDLKELPGPFASYTSGSAKPLMLKNFNLLIVNRAMCYGIPVVPLDSLKFAADKAKVTFSKGNQTLWVNFDGQYYTLKK